MLQTAIILAAGRGMRLRPLTDTCPKPLIKVQQQALLDYHIQRLINAKVQRVVINLAWLGEQIIEHVQQRQWQQSIDILFSQEPERGLETAGGIHHALHLLGSDPFIVLNADIYTDFDLNTLALEQFQQGHLVLVDNPIDHNGDFSFSTPYVMTKNDRGVTYSGISVFNPDVFKELPKKFYPMKPILLKLIAEKALTGQKHTGIWSDIGTVSRLQQIEQQLKQR